MLPTLFQAFIRPVSLNVICASLFAFNLDLYP